MKYCWNPKLKRDDWEEARRWHFKYVWWPSIIKLEGGTRCFVWLEHVQRRAIDSFACWAAYPGIRSYKWRL